MIATATAAEPPRPIAARHVREHLDAHRAAHEPELLENDGARLVEEPAAARRRTCRRCSTPQRGMMS